MEILLIIVVIVGFVIIGYLILQKKEDSNLLDVIRMLQSGSNQSSQAFAQLQRSIGEVTEIGRSMRQLQDLLKSPKLRGNIGEQVLKELLSQMLPQQSFHLQYSFKSGERVDAAIKTGAGIIPIDSKFPMENFRALVSTDSTSQDASRDLLAARKLFERDVKGHIDDISKKYIKTDEGTIDYALMYVPSEAVYYEIVNNLSIFEYAASKRVLPVSPSTFYAYLRSILMSMEGNKVSEKAREIVSILKSVEKEYEKTQEVLLTLNRHLTNASNTMNTFSNSFTKLGSKIASVKYLSPDKEKVYLDQQSKD